MYRFFIFLSVLFVFQSLKAQSNDGKKLDSLIHLSYSENSEERYTALLELAEMHLFSDSIKANKYLSQIEPDGMEDSLRKDILYKKINLLRKSNQNSKALKILFKELKKAKKENDSAEQAFIHKNISTAYYFSLEYDSSLIHINAAAEIYLEEGDSVNYGTMLLRKGNISYAKGDYLKAIEYGMEAKDFFMKMGTDSFLATAYVQLGNIYYFLKNYEDAATNYQLAYDYYMKVESSSGAAVSLINLGLIRTEQKRHQEGLELQKKALPLLLIEGNVLQHAESYGLIAWSFYDLKMYDSAKVYLEKSYQLNEKHHHPLGVSDNHFLRSELFLMENNLDSALHYALESYQLLDPKYSIEHTKDVYELLYRIYDKKGETEPALKYLKDHLALKESLSIDERSLQIMAFQEKKKMDEVNFQMELMKERETIMERENKIQRYYLLGISFIAFLALLLVFLLTKSNKKNQKLNYALKTNQKKIQEDLEVKESLIKEIHHRVKNNLQIISSMLNIQSEYLEDERLKDVIHECRNRINSMSLIHESLYKREDNLSDAIFSKYIENLIPQLLDTYHIEESKIKLEMDIDDIQLSLDETVPTGLMINEIISNSLKHAFPNGRNGTIKLSIKKKKNNIKMILADDGVGFKEKVELDKAESFGMLLISLLASQLNADIKIFAEEGTVYIIEWQIN